MSTPLSGLATAIVGHWADTIRTAATWHSGAQAWVLDGIADEMDSVLANGVPEVNIDGVDESLIGEVVKAAVAQQVATDRAAAAPPAEPVDPTAAADGPSDAPATSDDASAAASTAEATGTELPGSPTSEQAAAAGLSDVEAGVPGADVMAAPAESPAADAAPPAEAVPTA